MIKHFWSLGRVFATILWMLPAVSATPTVFGPPEADESTWAEDASALESTPSPTRKFWFHLNGLTIHFDKQPKPGETVNDYLFGGGFTWDFHATEKWTYAVEFDAFLDSNEEISAILGPSARYHLTSWASLGATGMVMYKEAFDRDYGFPVLPLALPFLQAGFEYLQVRMYYIPPVRRSTDEQLTFQLLFSLPL